MSNITIKDYIETKKDCQFIEKCVNKHGYDYSQYLNYYEYLEENDLINEQDNEDYFLLKEVVETCEVINDAMKRGLKIYNFGELKKEAESLFYKHFEDATYFDFEKWWEKESDSVPDFVSEVWIDLLNDEFDARARDNKDDEDE